MCREFKFRVPREHRAEPVALNKMYPYLEGLESAGTSLSLGKGHNWGSMPLFSRLELFSGLHEFPVNSDASVLGFITR